VSSNCRSWSTSSSTAGAVDDTIDPRCHGGSHRLHVSPIPRAVVVAARATARRVHLVADGRHATHLPARLLELAPPVICATLVSICRRQLDPRCPGVDPSPPARTYTIRLGGHLLHRPGCVARPGCAAPPARIRFVRLSTSSSTHRTLPPWNSGSWSLLTDLLCALTVGVERKSKEIREGGMCCDCGGHVRVYW
jgi:hypothetical protein